MSNKLKRESKKAQKQQEEEMQEAFKEAQKIRNSKYLPEVQVVISGAEFAQIYGAVETTLQQNSQTVYDLQGQRTGFTMPDTLIDLNNAMGVLTAIHKDNYEKRVAIPHEDFVAEMEKRRQLHLAKQQEEAEATEEPEADSDDLPNIEEEVSEDKKVIELSSKK